MDSVTEVNQAESCQLYCMCYFALLVISTHLLASVSCALNGLRALQRSPFAAGQQSQPSLLSRGRATATLKVLRPRTAPLLAFNRADNPPPISSIPTSPASPQRLPPPLPENRLEVDKIYGGRWIVPLFDKVAERRIDDNTEDEYWVFPAFDDYRILRKDTNVAEIAIGGFAAGIVVELLVAVLSYPFDTVKTRLQAKPKRALKKYPKFGRLYDGFAPVLFTVPALSVFWATKDVVRAGIIGSVKQRLIPWPLLDTFATGIGATLGEAIYWMIKAPSEVLKTQQQAVAVQEEVRQELDVKLSKKGFLPSKQKDFLRSYKVSVGQDTVPRLQQQMEELNSLGIGMNRNISRDAKKRFISTAWQVLKAWPVLAIVDVPFVGLRVSTFVALHDTDLIQNGFTGDWLQYLFANVLAILLTTPLDVVRTQMLLKNRAIQELPSVVKELYDKEGLSAFVAGWSPRVLYNGLIIGTYWGIVRQGYNGIRNEFLLDVLDRVEAFLDALGAVVAHPDVMLGRFLPHVVDRVDLLKKMHL